MSIVGTAAQFAYMSNKEKIKMIIKAKPRCKAIYKGCRCDKEEGHEGSHEGTMRWGIFD